MSTAISKRRKPTRPRRKSSKSPPAKRSGDKLAIGPGEPEWTPETRRRLRELFVGGPEFGVLMLRDASRVVWPGTDPDEAQRLQTYSAQAAVSIAETMKPRDPAEAMLLVQMQGLHNLALELMRRALIPGQPSQYEESCTARAQKLTRAYGLHMETLARYRRGETKQTVRVEHVNVESGGQAIVGAVAQGAGGDGEETGG